MVTTGAQQALDLVGKIFLDPGDVVALEAPAYVGALTAFGAYEPRFLPIPIDDDGMVVDDLERALVAGERPTFVYTVPNFGNPAGVTLSYERREQPRRASAARPASRSSRTTPTACCGSTATRSRRLRSLDPENVIYLGTVSKTFSPGVRVGWALAEQSVVQRLVLAKEAADLCGSNLNMLVTERWFARRGPVAWHAGTPRRRPTGDAATRCSRRSRSTCPTARRGPCRQGGFYVWVTVPAWLDTKALLAKAVESRVAYVPGTAFYPDGRGTRSAAPGVLLPDRGTDPSRASRGSARCSRTRSQLYRSLGGGRSWDRGARGRPDARSGTSRCEAATV